MRHFILTHTEQMLNFSENQDSILASPGRNESRSLTEVCTVPLVSGRQHLQGKNKEKPTHSPCQGEILVSWVVTVKKSWRVLEPWRAQPEKPELVRTGFF